MECRYQFEERSILKHVAQRAPRAAFACAVAATGFLHHGMVPASEPAANYPSKPVRLIVAQGTGSSVDTLGRILAARLTDEWGKQVIVDNRGGAGGIIGAEIASRSAPDGYTLLVSSTAMQVISPQLYKTLTYHPTRDFAQLSMTSTPGEMLKLINAEYGRFTQAIKLAGLTMQ